MTLPFTPEERDRLIARIRAFPDELEALVAGLDEATLRAQPIAGEWSVAQIVHHLADSHMFSFLRIRLILTADRPMLLGYDQDAWALLPDIALPISESLAILRGLHARWAALFESLTDAQWERVGVHSERGELKVATFLPAYARHCDEHADQIRRTLAAQA
jgi:hypothetical protein